MEPTPINSEAEAIAALEGVLRWAERAPNGMFRGGSTGVTYHRERVIATRVLPDRTVGVSTYNSIGEAAVKAENMDRGYRAWERLARKT